MPIFDFNTIKDFDDHIRKSIPDFSTLDYYIKEFIYAYQQKNTAVIDLGCSTGSRILDLERDDSISYFGVDSSDLIKEGVRDGINFVKENVLDFNFVESSVITSVFFLQFLSRIQRRTVLEKIKNHLVSGGVFICCEKIHFDNSRMESISSSIAMNWKRNNFSDAEILDKNFKLKNTMFLLTYEALKEELNGIGEAIQFWQSQGFVGFIVIKK